MPRPWSTSTRTAAGSSCGRSAKRRPAADQNIENFTGTGSQTSFILAESPLGEDYMNIFINGVYQNKNTWSITGNTILFSEAPPFTSAIEVEY